MSKKKILAIGGLTCTGKTTLALSLGTRLGGPGEVEMVVCDAVKVYRGADIGSGKLPPHERQGFSFHMVDVVAPGERYSAGRYMAEGRAAIKDIWNRRKLPLVVGGTGLYLRALIRGLCPAPPGDAEIRERLRRRKNEGEDLFETLSRVDPAAAAKIARDDEKRIIRALEVFELTGRPISSLRREGAAPVEADAIMVIWLDAGRQWLLPRVSLRTRRMLDAGIVEEAEKLVRAAGNDAAPPLEAIGYREAVNSLRGEAPASGLADAITAATMGLAKRQRTWFKREEGATRLVAEEETDKLTTAVLTLWREYC